MLGHPGTLAGVIGCAAVGLLSAILLVMLVVHRQEGGDYADEDVEVRVKQTIVARRL